MFNSFHLHDNINKAIALCGYTDPTPVQGLSIPEIMAGKDVAVSAQTGTGKTASFVLPALHNLAQQPTDHKTRILILTPTRELADQVTKAASLYGKFMRFNIVSIVGGMPYPPQIKALARGAEIIVATPGRLMDHIEQKRIDLSHIAMFVLDEADRMLDMGFIDDVQYIAKLIPEDRQTLLFSATLDSKLMKEVKHLLKDPVRIDLSSEKIAAPKIKQEMYKVSSMHHKTRLLKHFLGDKNIYKAIIFTSTKSHADKLSRQLTDDGFAAAALHGDKRQNVRNRTMDQLRRGKIQYLVATDVAARGIDVSDITHVINYDLPKFAEDYVHRIGRTGRAGKSGVAISFVSPPDMRNLQFIERYTGQRIKLMDDPESHHENRDEVFISKQKRPEKRDFQDEHFSNARKKPFRHDHQDTTFSRDKKNKHFERELHTTRFDRDKKRKPFDRENRSEKPWGKSKSYKSDFHEHKPHHKSDRRAAFKEDHHKPDRRSGFKEGHHKSDRGMEFQENRHKPDRRTEFKEGRYKSDRRTEFKEGRHKSDRRTAFNEDHRKSDRRTAFKESRHKPDRRTEFKESRYKSDRPTAFTEGHHKSDRRAAFKEDHRKSERRVEFKENHRKTDGENNKIRVEFKKGKRKLKFDKYQESRDQRKSHQYQDDRKERKFKGGKRTSSRDKNHTRFDKEKITGKGR